MNITRTINGQKISIVLTEWELRNAYDEQTAYYDREDVSEYLSQRMGDLIKRHGLTEDEIKAKVPEIAAKYREAIHNGAFDWWAVVCDVTDDVLQEEANT